jgi:hypothetical protein
VDRPSNRIGGAPPDDEAGGAWAARAAELADWAWHRLVNRTDAWGGYRPPEEVGREYVGRDGKAHKLGAQTTRKGLLDRGRLFRHFAAAGREDVVGLHSTSPANTSLWGGLDIDWHGPTSTAPEVNLRAALAWYDRLVAMGFRPLLTDSNGKGGYHLLLLLAEPAPTPRVHHYLKDLVADHAAHGMARPPELFPKQPQVTERNPFGNWLRVPGRHHTRDHHSRVWDGAGWLSGGKAVERILALGGDPTALVPELPPVPPVPSRPPKPVRPMQVCYSLPSAGGDVTSRVRAYLARLPHLGEGQGRDDVAYQFACWLVRDLALADEVALAWLARWDAGNRPPKGEARLREILDSAHHYGRHAYGAGSGGYPTRPWGRFAGIRKPGRRPRQAAGQHRTIFFIVEGG